MVASGQERTSDESMIRYIAYGVLICGCGRVWGQSATEPTSFEAYVDSPSAVVITAAYIGTINSLDANVDIAFLVAEERSEPGSNLRGVRFSLRNNARSDQAYLGEGELLTLRQELATMERMRGLVDEGRATTPRVLGAEICWMPKDPARILCPSYYEGPAGSGLALNVYGSSPFSFPGHELREIITLVDAAMAKFAP